MEGLFGVILTAGVSDRSVEVCRFSVTFAVVRLFYLFCTTSTLVASHMKMGGTGIFTE